MGVCVTLKNFIFFRKAAQIIDGKKIAAEIKKELKRDIEEWVQNNNNRAPSLVAILVGEDPASKKYVHNKMQAAKEVGECLLKFKLSAAKFQPKLQF